MTQQRLDVLRVDLEDAPDLVFRRARLVIRQQRSGKLHARIQVVRVFCDDLAKHSQRLIGPAGVLVTGDDPRAHPGPLLIGERRIIGGALAKSVKALIAHDAGVGKDQAAIGGLPYGDRYGVPVAAVDCRTATLSNGNSALAGTISHANQAASSPATRR